MKALVFEKSGLDNLGVQDVEKPVIGPHDILIKVKMAGVNPIDYRVVSSMPHVKLMPHIPSAEFAGIVDEVGDYVTS